MAWVYIIVGGLMEMAWAVGLERSEGFTKLGPSAWTLVTMFISIYLLSLGLKSIPVGTGYAVWTGIGAAGTALVGMLFLGEPRTAARIFCLMLIIAGIVGLQLLSSH